MCFTGAIVEALLTKERHMKIHIVVMFDNLLMSK